MKKFLDEIMKESDKGYIDDLEHIEVLAKKMICLTYADLSAAKGYNTAALITDLVRANNYPECDVDTISFGDMLTLAAFNDYYEYDRFYDKLANLLLLISSVNTDVKLFTSVSVKALMELVDKKTDTDKGSRMYEKIEEYMGKYFCRTISEDTTVKLLAGTLISKMTNRPLSMYMVEFNDIVDVSLEILEMLIVKALRDVFSEELDYKPLQERICENTDIYDDDCVDWQALCEELD